MTHTPGPWHIGMTNVYNVDRFAKNAEWARIRGVDGGLIAKIESVHPKGERKSQDFDIEAANARLIASAPELLEALKKIVAWHDCFPPTSGEEDLPIISQARAAIAQAEGR